MAQVSVESQEAVFCVGVAHKPLFTDKNGSPAFWALEAHTGQPPHLLKAALNFNFCNYCHRTAATLWGHYRGPVYCEGEGQYNGGV